MPKNLRFSLVDAFAERPFQGNAAGVVLDADKLADEQMQRVAREINASETAFVSRGNDLHRSPLIRWFTPQAEVDFCGHATLAATHALHEEGRLADLLARPDATLIYDSAAGELRLKPETLPEPENQLVWWLNMPDPGLRPDNTNPVQTCQLLGLDIKELDASLPAMRTRDNDLIYMIQSWQALNDMRPSFDELADWCRRGEIRGICVATTATVADSLNVQSRFFAPAVGINEDPVTGSVHGPLAVYLVVNGLVGSAAGKSGLFCGQSIPGDRSGLVRALVESHSRGYRVKIGGLCHTTLTGQLRTPERS